MKLITIIGARPQIIKASAISRAIAAKFSDKITEIIVHTGQHYDDNMSEIFFNEMQIPCPKYNLSVGSGKHGAQTAHMLEGLEEIYEKENPDAIVVYGDTNSTVAGALAAIKLHIPVIHIEAGLRSFNKKMPEEVNRIACDHMSTLLFSPTKSGVENLKNEGFSAEQQETATVDAPNVYHCGDIMYDNSLYFSTISREKSIILEKLDIKANNFILCTVHRPSNTDTAENLEGIFEALLAIQEESKLDIILPLHPRTRKKMTELLSSSLQKKLENNTNIRIIAPAGFLDIIALEESANLIITDSGGLQKEAYFFQKPCIILREQTEWIEIVENGNALLTGANYDKIISAFHTLRNKSDLTHPPFYGDGNAAEFICSEIIKFIPC